MPRLGSFDRCHILAAGMVASPSAWTWFAMRKPHAIGIELGALHCRDELSAIMLYTTAGEVVELDSLDFTRERQLSTTTEVRGVDDKKIRHMTPEQ